MMSQSLRATHNRSRLPTFAFRLNQLQLPAPSPVEIEVNRHKRELAQRHLHASPTMTSSTEHRLQSSNASRPTQSARTAAAEAAIKRAQQAKKARKASTQNNSDSDSSTNTSSDNETATTATSSSTATSSVSTSSSPPPSPLSRSSSSSTFRIDPKRLQIGLDHILRDIPDDTTDIWLMNFLIDLDFLEVLSPRLFSVPQRVVIFAGCDISSTAKNVKVIRPPTPTYGTHHSKGMLLFTPRGVRVCIHTANYIQTDVLRKTQGVWVQDFPLKSSSPSYSSSSASTSSSSSSSSALSDFEQQLVNYFRKCCGANYLSLGMDPRQILGKFDFAAARGALVTSVPG